jgi:hypothetical protein
MRSEECLLPWLQRLSTNRDTLRQSTHHLKNVLSLLFITTFHSDRAMEPRRGQLLAKPN